MTDNKEIKKDILVELSSQLTKYGFKKKGDSFIRETESGLYQIIDIGLGRSTTIKANHVGVGFGIATEEWLNNLIKWKRPKILTSADCEIRDCFCNLVPISDETIWYPISLGLTPLINKIDSHIQKSIVPYLDRIKTRHDIINMWRQHQHDIGFAEGRQLLAIGTLMFLTGDKDEGERILKKLIVDNKDNSYFTSTINKTLGQLSSSH
ncbi:MAG: DUF4304 domain-containing protein [Bacteroidota bacterium]|nr:DUF4304 domain-containing protein [Bacteroidota bacterium]